MHALCAAMISNESAMAAHDALIVETALIDAYGTCGELEVAHAMASATTRETQCVWAR